MPKQFNYKKTVEDINKYMEGKYSEMPSVKDKPFFNFYKLSNFDKKILKNGLIGKFEIE